MHDLDYVRKGLKREERPKRTLNQKLDRIGLIVVIVIVSVIYGGGGLFCLVAAILHAIYGLDSL